MKKKRLAIAALAAIPFFGIVYFPSQSNYAQEAPKTAVRPHYLRDLNQPTDEVEQIIEEARVMDANRSRFATTTYRNGNIEHKQQVQCKEVTFVFHNYSDQGDYIRYGHSSGFDELTRDGFAAVRSDIVTTLDQAAREAYAEHSNLTRRIIELQEAHLKKNNRLAANEKLEDLLDREVAGAGITYAD